MISAYSGGNHSRWIPVLATSDIRSEKRRSRAAWCQHKWPDSVQVHRVSSCSPVKEGEQTQFLQSLFSERMSEVASTVTVSVSLRSPVVTPVALRRQVTLNSTSALRISRTAWF